MGTGADSYPCFGDRIYELVKVTINRSICSNASRTHGGRVDCRREGGSMDCIYNTGVFCYKNPEEPEECRYIGDLKECDSAEEG